ncbi:MAG: serine/threonine protein kinase [Myxococcales bacterium]|nr:serine/threonine protein kinase [Myxococcales bacterium]
MRPDPANDTLVGTVIGGRYQLLRRIGKGGMGLVYEADHLGIGKRVAVKVLLDKYTDDPEVVARFEREARTASSIGDDHIVEVFDAGTTDDGRSYLVMELLIGSSLADIAEATGPMPAARAVPIVRQVLRGLAAAHAKGIVHRDMKPENVFLIQKADRPDFAKIMDFGISKFLQDSESKVRLTATGAVIGTPVYMAPEQALGAGEIDGRVDLYAVGVMLYELLAGRPPFQAPTYIALVTQHLHTPPPPLQLARPDLPTPLVVAVHRALEKDPAARFASAAEMAAAMPTDVELASLDAIATLTGGRTIPDADYTAPGSARGRIAKAAVTPGGAAVPTTSRRPGPTAPPRTTTRLRRWPWMAAVVAVAATIGATTVVIALRPSKRPPAAAGPAAAPSPVLTGSLEIVSDPAGATVEVDGAARGVTPLVVAGLAAGVHEVRLVRDGFAPVVMRKAVREGRDETLSAVMAKAEAPAPADPPRPGGRRGAPAAGAGSARPPASAGSAASPAGSGSGSATSPAGAGSGSATSPAGAGSGSDGGSATPRPRPPKNPEGDPPPPDRKGNPFGS